MDTTGKLNLLSSYQRELQIIQANKQAIIEEVLTDEIKQKLAEIDAEFDENLSMVNSKITELEAEVKRDVINFGATVKGDNLMAVYNKGRVSWDSSGLNGYRVAHPEIEAFRKEGDPTVTLRKTGKGE